MALLILFLNIFNIYAADIEVDTNIRYQTFQGWETGLSIVSHTGTLMGTDTTYKYITDDLMDLMVDSIGVTRCRIEFRSGVENTNDNWQDMIDGKMTYDEWKGFRYLTVNDNDDPNDLDMSGFHFSELDNKIEVGLLPLKNKLEESGQKLYINLCYVAFAGNLSNEEYIQDDPDEYAEVVLAAFKHISEKYGFTPDALEVILEPDVAKFGDGKLVGECIVATGDLLKDNGFTPDFIALSNTNMNNAVNDNYLTKFLNVPRVLEYWKEFSYHAYTGRTDENFIKIADIGKQYNVRTSMLEWWNLGHKYDFIHKSLKLANNSSYQYMSSISAPLEGSDHYAYMGTEFISPDNYNIDLKVRTKYASQYIKNIRPGDVRVEATSNDPNVDPLAFIDKNGNLKFIIMCETKTQIEIVNLEAGDYNIFYTSGNGVSTITNYEKTIYKGRIEEGDHYKIDIPSKSILVIKKEMVTSSVNEIDNSIKVYPNPTNNFINIDFESKQKESLSIELIDINGNFIRELYQGISELGTNKFNFDLANLSSSVYLLKFTFNGMSITRKISKAN